MLASIEKFNKEELGLASNTDYTLDFTKSKIFTVLPNTEIVRLFDNVPLKAQAQTIMGNRLVYGNYVDGFDLIDLNTNPVKLEYTVGLVSEEVGAGDVSDETAPQDYSIDGAVTIQNARVNFDLNGLELKAGATVTFDIRFDHSQFSGQTPFPSETTDNVDYPIILF